MTRGGRTKERGEPERRCIVTRAVKPRAGLIRFVAGPDDVVVPDLAEKLPGRGMWVSADAAALGQAAKKGHFARAAKRPVKAPVRTETAPSRVSSDSSPCSERATSTGAMSLSDTEPARAAIWLLRAS